MAIKFRNQKLHEMLMERKCGPMDPKAGKHIKRAKQNKQDRRDMRSLMDQINGDDYV